jgi:hypothetical protein
VHGLVSAVLWVLSEAESPSAIGLDLAV